LTAVAAGIVAEQLEAVVAVVVVEKKLLLLWVVVVLVVVVVTTGICRISGFDNFDSISDGPNGLEEETETGLEVLAVLGTVGMLGIEGIVGTGFDDLPASLPARKEGFGGGTFNAGRATPSRRSAARSRG
jgi:hypothetical protein